MAIEFRVKLDFGLRFVEVAEFAEALVARFDQIVAAQFIQFAEMTFEGISQILAHCWQITVGAPQWLFHDFLNDFKT